MYDKCHHPGHTITNILILELSTVLPKPYIFFTLMSIVDNTWNIKL